jgi:hypothetical protein
MQYHLDVVFVHGLGSVANAWKNKKTQFIWPDKLGAQDPHLRVLTEEYFAPMFKSSDTAVEA